MWTNICTQKRTQSKVYAVLFIVYISLSARFVAIISTFSTKNKPAVKYKQPRKHASAQQIMKTNYACMQLQETQSIIQNQYSLWVFAQGWG